MSLIYITGGVRSGKSGFGERLANEATSVLYIATGMAFDDEMKKRVKLHQERRPARWRTLETPDSLLAGVPYYAGYDTVLIDCLSSWISNQLMKVEEAAIRDQRVEELTRSELTAWLNQVKALPQTIIVISNEVGLGGVAMSRLGRWFQDVLGEANQLVAAAADEAYAVFSGIPVRLKP